MAGVSRTAAARSRSAVAWVRADRRRSIWKCWPAGARRFGQRLAVGLQGAHAVLDGRDNGVSAATRSCMARTAPAVQRRLLVSKGTWVDSRRSWVMSLARVRRSLSDLPASPPARMSCIQSRASRTALSSSSVSAGARPRGSTTLWTSVAQTMPNAISSTRASAVSNTSVGSETDGKPIMAAV